VDFRFEKGYVKAHDLGRCQILCDLMLPGMTGVDFLEVLGTRWPALADRLVFITGGAVTERAKRGLESAKNPPLEKPFSGDALTARVDALLRL
jgi:DNA-binding response OmpR family regulator